MLTPSTLGLLVALTLLGQAAPPRPQGPPTRDPKTSGYVDAKELPDGAVPPADANGNFIIGPTHPPAPEVATRDLDGTVYTFTMSSVDSKIYPGIARDAGTFGTPDPNDPAKLVVTTSHPFPYTRRVSVYVPKQYIPGSAAPFIVGADGPDQLLFNALDGLIAQKKVPVMIAISIANGSGDAQGSQRGLEYDTMSGRYAEFVETEVLPLVEKQYGVRLSKNPDERATMGTSSGATAALSMAWYHPEWYHRVLSYSGTFINQQWPPNPDSPHGGWAYHETMIPGAARQADPHLARSGRSRSPQSQRHARQHARLGRRERADGEGAGREGLSLSVRVCEERRSRGPADEDADAARSAGVALEVARVAGRGAGHDGLRLAN